MSFKKTGEIKVYKKGQEVGPDLADVDEKNRYTIDAFVKDASKNCNPKSCCKQSCDSEIPTDPKDCSCSNGKDKKDVSN